MDNITMDNISLYIIVWLLVPYYGQYLHIAYSLVLYYHGHISI